MKAIKYLNTIRLRVLVPSVIALIFGLGLSGLVSAESETDPQNCVACHDDHAMQGVHAGTLFGPTNLVADCADCHGFVTSLSAHEKNGSDVIRFGWQQSTVHDQNQKCLSCHAPAELRLAHWTHDAHGDGLACASCHSLHTPNDAVRGLTRKAEIQLCVACHSEISSAGEGE